MPVITFESGKLTKETKEKLIQQLTHLSVQITGIPKELFFISIRELPDEDIAVGGITVKDLKQKMSQNSVKVQILNSSSEDIEEIYRLYRLATEFQKGKFIVHWPEFERSMIEKELAENRQWKLLIDNKIACVWATTFDDPLIWKEKNEDPAVYIHRIATNPDFRGRNLVKEIVTWARKYARDNDKKFIRMDTVGDNKKLIEHYKSCGFEFLGFSKMEDSTGLPPHYDQATVCLFEIEIK